jgi:ketosteroid isomerase-like protein
LFGGVPFWRKGTAGLALSAVQDSWRPGLLGRDNWIVASTSVDLIRSLYAAWERGNWGSAEWADPEIEFVGADGPDPFSVKGIDKLAEAWAEFLQSWEDYRVEAEEYRELDDERVLVLIRIGGRGKTSGLEIGQMRAEAANLISVRDGRVTRLVLYWDRERALADVGLTSETGPQHS